MRSRAVLVLFLFFLLLLVVQPLNAQETVEVGPYGGGSFFNPAEFVTSSPNPETHQGYKFVPGGVLGFRIRENLKEHFGLEQSLTFLGTNNVQFPSALVGSRLRQFYFNGNFIGFGDEDRIRPYFSGGAGMGFYSPTDDGKASAANTVGPIGGANNFQFNVGGGLKFKLTDRFGLDFSVRDFIQKIPTFDFPNVTHREWIHNFQPQGGFMIYFGSRQPPIVHTFTVGPEITADKTTLCPGESTTLRINASDSVSGNRITYKWTVDGQETQATGPEYQFTAPAAAGPHEVAVHVFYDSAGLDKRSLKAIKKNPGSPADRKTTLTVNAYNPPQATATADRTTVQRGERVRLTGRGTGSQCSGNLSYRWTVNRGRITSGADQASSELNTGDLAFSESVQGRQEQKILATLEVADQKGGKATATQEITVTYMAPPPPAAPKAMQLSDINFAKDSARVNNCAKRILANEVYSQLTDSRYRDYDILLVGHTDQGEKPRVRSKKKIALDRERTLNAAAFLSGKGDTCKDIELSRVKLAWVGEQQNSEFKSNFCDTSTREKSSDKISGSDEKAKNRRVEIWLVPKGAELPSGVGNVQDVPQDEVTRKGCPK